MKQTVKTLTVKNIRRGAPRPDGNPGNLVVNQTEGQPLNWFSSVEHRNNLLGAEWPLDTPVSAFLNARMTYKQLEIEPADVAAGPIKVMINGREVTFKQPGINNVEMQWDFSTVAVTDDVVNVVKMKSFRPENRGGARRTTVAARPAPAQLEEGLDNTDLGAGDDIGGEDQGDKPLEGVDATTGGEAKDLVD